MTTPDKQVEFLSRLTASTTHEIRNVLAIIKESAGLMDDIVRSDQPVERNRDRLQRAMGRIDAQVKRGVDLISYLNQLAHSVDRGESAVDLNVEVQQAATLSQRFARTRGHQVEGLPGDEGLAATVNPLGLQMALVAVTELCLDRMSAPGTVTLRAVRQGPAAGVEFRIETGGGPAPSGAEPVWAEEVLGEIGATIVSGQPGCFRMALGGTGGRPDVQ